MVSVPGPVPLPDDDGTLPAGGEAWWAGVSAVVAASAQPMAVVDREGRCLIANAACHAACGGAAAVLGHIINWPVEAVLAPLGGADGNSSGLRLVTLPVQTPATDGLLTAALNALPVMVSIKDAGERYLFVNASHAVYYGVSAAAAIGRTTAELAGQRYGDFVGRLDRAVINSGCASGFVEGDAAGADGRMRNWLMNKSPLKDAYGRVTGVVTLAVDVTAAKEREEALTQARDRAEEAGKARGRYLATVGHELRTPLHSIVGFAEFLAQETLGPLGHPTYREYAEDMLTAGRHLLDVVNDILDMARLEAGRLPLDEEPVDLCRSLGDAVRMLALPARHKGTTIQLECPPSMPAVIADPRRLRQIMINLLNNAIKYTPAGGRITVSVGREPGGDVVVEVADNGIGIAPADLPTALAPFGRVQREHASGQHISGQDGVGLGLPLVKALLEAHGGRFELMSEPGVGTRARAILPRYRLRP